MTVDAALCAGVNQYGHGSDLAGCVPDALDWSSVLRDRGAQVTTLLDGDATGENIREGIRELVEGLKYGQTGVVTWSGHGSWLPDRSGDEPDRRDEVICPIDVFDHGNVTDDELFDLFTRRAYGAKLIFISDSCHSGTVNRLAGPLNPPAEGDRPARAVRFLPPAAFLDGEQLNQAERIGYVRAARSRTSALLMSGCRDEQFSYDAHFRDDSGQWRANGAFTYAALRALKDMPEDATYRQFHAAIRTMLPSSDFPQDPMLTGTSSQKRWRVFA